MHTNTTTLTGTSTRCTACAEDIRTTELGFGPRCARDLDITGESANVDGPTPYASHDPRTLAMAG